MHIKNFEFKARVENILPYEAQLRRLNPRYVGLDEQRDTYFQTAKGRLKLREGNIENALIQYERPDVAGAKASDIVLYPHEPHSALKTILTKQLGIKVVVEKKRKIYFIENVKFHFDVVEQLGQFIEVEAMDSDGSRSLEELKAQCQHYFQFFKLQEEMTVEQSYSDLILALEEKGKGGLKLSTNK